MEHEPLFGRWLRKRRKTLDLTQKELARRVGCSPATIRKIEAEQRRPSKGVALRLAASLGLEESEHQAFLGFARRGWLDGPLGASPSDGEPLPWRALPGNSFLPAATGIPPPLDEPPGRHAPVFVARERELASLERHLGMALDGHGRAAFVQGEPGSGKTALMAEFARRAQEAHPELLCATGACHAYTGVGDPYLPFRDLLEMLCGDVDRHRFAGPGSTVHARRLWEAFPDSLQALLAEGPELLDVFVSRAALARRVSERGGAARPIPAELAARRRESPAATQGPVQGQLFEQYASVLRRLATGHPLLLVVDDLQWADDASIALLFHLGRRLEGSRVLIIGATRPDEVAQGRRGEGGTGPHPLAPVLTELARQFGDDRVDLDRISAAENRAFVDALLDNEPNALGEGFRGALFARTEGHPLFVVELLRDLQARGDLSRDPQGRWREGATLDWQALPVRVDAVIAQRIDRLDGRLREVLRVASVEGEAFTAQVVARVLAVEELRLVQDLSQELDRRHRLVRELDDAVSRPARSRYRFAHALFQHHLYGSLGVAERRLLHGSVAQALTEMHQGDLDEVAVQLAHHYGRAGDEAQERSFLFRAAGRAQRLAAMEDATRLYRAALARWPGTDLEGRSRIQRQLAECLWVTGHLPEALRCSEASRDAYRSLGDPAATGALERQIGRLYWELGDRKQSLKHYHAALDILEQGPAGVELARVVSSISQMHMLAGDYEPALAWGTRALALARELVAEDVEVHALTNLGVSRAYMHDQETGLAMLREAARKAVALGLPHDAGRAYHCLGELLIWLCRSDEARTALGEMAAYADRHHVAMFRDTARLLRVDLDWRQGRWSAALDGLGQLASAWQTNPPQGIVALLAGTCRASLFNDLGLPRAALEELDGSLAAARETREQQIIAPFVGQLARSYAALGMEAQAAEAVREVLGWAGAAASIEPYGTLVPLLFACRWLTARSLHDDALACLGLLEQIDRQLGTPETRAVLCEARSATTRRPAAAARGIAQLREAVTLWREQDRPYDLLRALARLGSDLEASGNTREAREALERADAIVDDLSAQLEDGRIKAAFLASDLVRSAQSLRGKLPA